MSCCPRVSFTHRTRILHDCLYAGLALQTHFETCTACNDTSGLCAVAKPLWDEVLKTTGRAKAIGEPLE